MKRISIILLTLLVGHVPLLCAHDFTVTDKGGQKFFFNVIDVKKKYVEVTYQGSITSSHSSPYKGEMTIPSNVKHKDTVYRIVGISKKAFSGATSLKGIVLPSGLLFIDDFAFEGCSGLEKIVFPGNSVRLGEGTFFRCTVLSKVTLGSDWTQVNLKMFRWSKQLVSITIPAKVTSLQNLKSLSGLQSVEVDANNPNFISINGILYNKDKTTLLGCPRGYSGKVRIPEGTSTIRWGALLDCPGVTQVDLPASLKVLSYREFSRMKSLVQLIMRGEKPIVTANSGEQKCFLLKIADDSKVKLIVPKAAQNAYEEAICSTTGEYSEISSNTPEDMSAEYALIPLIVKPDNMLTKSNIIGVKSFSKYE